MVHCRRRAARAGHRRRLLSAATTFGNGIGAPETHLWAFPALTAPRVLSEAAGFAMAEQRSGRQWGEPVTEQRFVRHAVRGPEVDGPP